MREYIKVQVKNTKDKRKCSIYTHNGILFGYKKEWDLAIYNNMDEPWGHYAKWSKSDRERQILYVFTYMESKNKTNKWIQQNRNRLIDREQTSGYQREEWWGEGQDRVWELRVKNY